MSTWGPPWQANRQRIFISYRRDDSQWVAGRLADSLSGYFGDDRVFRDIDGIAAGERYGDVIEDTLSSADAVLVLIGRHWLDARDDQGRRRLDDVGDWVVQEVARALEADVPVYPVLVDDAPMPRADELPESLRALTRHNAFAISDTRWREDVARLGRIISLDIPSTTERRLDLTNMIVSTALFVAIAIVMTLFADRSLTYSAGGDDWSWAMLVQWHDDEGSWFGRLFAADDSAAGSRSGSCANPPQAGIAPVTTVQGGLVFLVMVPASVLLFVAARHVDPGRRHRFLAAAWSGAVGSLLAFLLLYPVCEEFEPYVIFYLGMLFAPLMLVFMSLSGFRGR